ncbi:MAG: YHS domain-containing protein [Gammaproteobacteria bacterium]
MEDGALRDRKSEQHSWVQDPVCGMRVDEWTATVHTDYKGKRVVFCSNRCLDRFDKEPGRYVLNQ